MDLVMGCCDTRRFQGLEKATTHNHPQTASKKGTPCYNELLKQQQQQSNDDIFVDGTRNNNKHQQHNHTTEYLPASDHNNMKTSFSNTIGQDGHSHSVAGDLGKITNKSSSKATTMLAAFSIPPTGLTKSGLLKTGLMYESQLFCGSGGNKALQEWLVVDNGSVKAVTSEKQNGFNNNNDSARASPYDDPTTILPATMDYNKVNPDVLIHLVEEVWIPILHRLQQEESVSSDLPSPQHHNAKVYHRLATLLLGLVNTTTGRGVVVVVDQVTPMDVDGGNDDGMAVSLSVDGGNDNEMVVAAKARSLAQRILREGRMKGAAYGGMMTHYYNWFTALAAECSECLGDTHTAHLCYKSIRKLEGGSGVCCSKVYGTIINDTNHGSVGGRSSGSAGVSRSGQRSSDDKTMVGAAFLPPTLSGLTPPGTLVERIRRTNGSNSKSSLMVGTFGVAAGNNVSPTNVTTAMTTI